MGKRYFAFLMVFLTLSGVEFILPGGSAHGIAPGQTKKYRVLEGNTDRHFTSTNGLRSFEIWVPDNETVVEARWYEETKGGHQWVHRGTERISGKNRRYSRTVYLRRTENFKLVVKGIHSSKGKRKICYYKVHCVKDPYDHVTTFESKNFSDLNTWFKAGPYQRWYWGGCGCWVLVNPVDKEIILMDGYVSKATVGGIRNYTYVKKERKRVARLVNLLRGFIAKGYAVTGVLISHDHGDHVGDLPYILGGIKADSDKNFMKTGMALTGRPYKGKITIVADSDAILQGRFGKSGYDSHYERLTRSNSSFAVFNGDTKVDNKPFTRGHRYNIGKFSVVPYIWDHGRNADGGVGTYGGRRTIAYSITRNGGRNAAKMFFTSGFCQDQSFINTINTNISAHHLIFAWNGNEREALAAKKIRLLGNSPVGSNYIFTNHTDNNSNPGDINNGEEEVVDLFGMFIDKGVVEHGSGPIGEQVHWNGQQRNVRLGAFLNRVGVDD